MHRASDTDIRTEWDLRDPGYFSVALFDHREFSSICRCKSVLNSLQICLFAMA